jgi:hypothetical protein
MALGLVFEGAYRMTMHLLGVRVLQTDSKARRFQYLMLDERGLCRPDLLDRVTSELDQADRVTARRCVLLAVKARNAMCHGAIVRFSLRETFGIGHLFMKSLLLLMSSGLQHMIREGAYHRWRFAGSHDGADSVPHWVAAEDQMFNRIDVKTRHLSRATSWRRPRR